MAKAELTIYVIPGQPVTGLWCPTCQLPSGVEWPMSTLTPRGVGSLGPFWTCTQSRAHKRDGGA